jgi:hypothetical protein
MLSVHHTFDEKYIYILKVMRNVKGWNYGMKKWHNMDEKVA